MEIVLKKEDLERLVKFHYKNAKSIKFSSKNPKVIIDVDSFEQGVEPKPVRQHDIKTVSVPTPEKKEKPQGTMGPERKIVNL